jgi:hypothetical protein
MTLASNAIPSQAVPVDSSSRRWSGIFADWIFAHRKILWSVALFSYLAAYNGQWQMTPDSALYLALGRNLATGHGYSYNGAPHDMVYPGLPFVLAGLYKIFGSDGKVFAAADALILICGVLTLGATFRLVRLAFDRTTAHVVALGLAGVHEFYRYCYTILTDIPFLLGVTCFLCGHEAIFGKADRRGRWYDWGLLLVGLAIAIVMRPNMIGLLAVWLGVLVWTIWRDPSHRRAAASAIGMAAVLAALFIFLDPRHALSSSASSSYERTILMDFTQNLHHRLTVDAVGNLQDLLGITAARAAFGMPWGFWWINAIVGAAALAAGLALFQVRAIWGWWVVVTIATLVLIVSHDRYMLQISPLLVLGWWRCLVWMNHKLPQPIGNWVFGVLLTVGLLGNNLQLGNIMLRQHLRPFYAYYAGGDYFGYPQMAKRISQTAAPGDLVICAARRSRVLSFLSDRPVVEYTEPAAQDFSAGPPLIVFDADDAAFASWLAASHLTLDKTPIASFKRNAGQSALVFARGRVGN